MTVSQVLPPSPHRQQSDIQILFTNLRHTREKVGVPGEIHIVCAAHQVAQAVLARAARKATLAVLCMRGLNDQRTQVDFLACGAFPDILEAALPQPPTYSFGQDHERILSQVLKRRQVEMILVGMGDQDCGQLLLGEILRQLRSSPQVKDSPS